MRILNATFIIVIFFTLLGVFTFAYIVINFMIYPNLKEPKKVEILQDFKEINLNGIIYRQVEK